MALFAMQYCARMNPEKLKSFVHRLSEGRIGKQFFNMRLAPEDISNSLTGVYYSLILLNALELVCVRAHSELKFDYD